MKTIIRAIGKITGESYLFKKMKGAGRAMQILPVLLLTMLLESCLDKDGIAPFNAPVEHLHEHKPGSPPYFLRYKVNGIAIVADSLSARRDISSNNSYWNSVKLSGTAKTTMRIPRIDFSLTEGTYWCFDRHDFPNKNTDISYIDSNRVQYHSAVYPGSMTVIFSELSFTAGGKISGTFFGEISNTGGKDTIRITEGEFNLSFSN